MKPRTLLPLLIAALLPLIVLTPACGKKPTLKAIKASKSHVEFTVSTTTAGTVEARQQATLAFGLNGRVEQILIQPGAQVQKGKLLAKLENRDLQSVFSNAEKDLSRAKELFKDQLISQASLDEATKMFELARANQDKSEIRAPFDGVVTDINLQVGEPAQLQSQADKPPMRIVDQKPRIIKGNIDEVDLAKIQLGAKARVKVLASRPTPFEARVDRIVPYVSTSKEQERTAKVELSLSADTPLLPVGASAEVEIIVQAKENVLAVPSRTVLGAGSQRYVYRFESGKIKKSPITIGIGNYDRTEILAGISEGDTIILPGDIDLKDAMSVNLDLQEH